MAAGNSNDNSKNIKFYGLKAKAGASEKDTPKWGLSEKGADGKWSVTQLHDFIEGNLNKAELVEKQIKDKKEKFFVLELEDTAAGEVYKCSMSHTNLAYSIINSLATDVNTISKYKILVYKKQKDKYWNAGAVIYQDGNTGKNFMPWSIPIDQTPKAVPITGADGQQLVVNGEKVWDKSLVRKFWEEMFNVQIVAKLNLSKRPAAVSQPAAQAAAAAPDISDPNTYEQLSDNDDLPF